MNKIKVPVLVGIAAVTLLSGCEEQGRETKPIAKWELLGEYGVDSTELVYQYYQRFGFTDVCEEHRLIAKPHKLPQFDKALPISQEDLKTIRNFSNKVDDLASGFNPVKYKGRAAFRDVELDFAEFYADSTVQVSMEKGSYEITKTTLKVYDTENKLLYIESHRCNGE